MGAGIADAWAGAVGNGAGIRVRRPPRKRTEPQRGSWLVVVGLRFCVGCVSVAIG